MSNAEHLIENALSCVDNGKRAEDFVEMEINSKANVWNRDYTAEEVLEMFWEAAMYVKHKEDLS